MDCLFCKIIAGEIPCNRVYEDERVLVFADIAPQAPLHLLAIPKEHVGGVDELKESNAGVVAHIFSLLPQIAAEQGLENGYRVVSNVGEDGAQSVRHLHFHLLGGKALNPTLG